MRSVPRWSASSLVLMFGLVVVVVGLAGCGRGASTGAGDLDAVAGRTFVSTSIVRDGVTTTLAIGLPGAGGASISFSTGGRLSATAGCNGTSARYSFHASTLRVEQGESTLIGCDAAIEAQDAWFVGFLTSDPAAVLAGDTLTLTKGSTVVTLQDRTVVDPDRPLVGPQWTLDTVFGAGGTASSTAGPKPTVTFRPDGTLVYTDSCAGGRARWARDGDTVTFSGRQGNPTVAACPPGGAEGRALQRTLDGAWTVTIHGPQLELKQGDVGIGLRADLAPIPPGATVPVTR